MSTSSKFNNLGITHTIEEYQQQYEVADRFCCEVQNFKNQAGIPAVNELRNAGKHFQNSINSEGNIQNQSELNAAISHVRRASYEATEAGIVSCLVIINKFKDDFSDIVISDFIPNYSEILAKAHSANRLISNGRETSFDRNGDHNDRIATFRELRDCCDTLSGNRDEANKVVRKETNKARITIISIIFSAVALIYGIPEFVDWYEDREKQIEIINCHLTAC